MAKKLITFFIITVLLASKASAYSLLTKRVKLEEKQLGVGITVGRAVGLSFKKWLDMDRAVNGDIAWSTLKENEINLRIQFLKHNLAEYEVDDVPLHAYAGAGTRFKITDKGEDSRLGIRGIAGTNYVFYPQPIEIFLEASPIFDIIPETTLIFSLNLGVHYYF
ncbi:MAG: hypothetical protein ACQEQC_05150 [Elusimicrobiota bacterium]